MMMVTPPADLVFAPTLAVWEVAQRFTRPHALLSESEFRTGLLLDRTMLPAALDGLRGPLCLRLASACNHRPRGINRRYYMLTSRKRQVLFAFFFHLLEIIIGQAGRRCAPGAQSSGDSPMKRLRRPSSFMQKPCQPRYSAISMLAGLSSTKRVRSGVRSNSRISLR